MKIDGGCHCGFIAYEAEIDADKVGICHCTDCQTLSGSAFRTGVPVSDTDFKLLAGEPKTYVKIAESGNRRAQVFCPECGTHIYATSLEDGPKILRLRSATARQRELAAAEDEAILAKLDPGQCEIYSPSDDDRAFVHSLMKREVEPGKFAGWIAPPARGVNHEDPSEFQYIRFN